MLIPAYRKGLRKSSTSGGTHRTDYDINYLSFTFLAARYTAHKATETKY